MRNTKMLHPLVVEFPLRGEWQSPNTPGTKIPSHGTDRLGTRYAYDFIQVDWDRRGWPSYRSSLAKYLTTGLPINDYYCWGKAIYAPCNGIVTTAEDNYPERTRTNLRSDLKNAYQNAHYFDPMTDDPRSVAGNHIIIKHTEKVYAAVCHLQTGSIQVTVGQSVKKGDFLGRVGHSGNSFGPHLHFQLMDSSDITKAKGLPCAFETYEIYQAGKWLETKNGVPTNRDRIRYSKEE
ncbi:M23 family metallopeptidase [Enterococcus sp. AZ109]|uniref:M23 family metallopeptidase n=1 Tax=Enterococcus sp. AZ109 TaxID=2774634 RepID=UPI003F296C7A